MLTRISTLAELADRLHDVFATPGAVHGWDEVNYQFTSWIDQPGLCGKLRNHLLELPADQAAAVINRSRETTTHYAWCLRDRPDEQFTFWLHEYKPARDWRPGYADTVHNHRYHFCTTILRGGYQHERYQATVDPTTDMISSAELLRAIECPQGASGLLLADEFHRIPKASDGTLTFLVKSREVFPWSLSYDPVTQASQRHVPVEARLTDLAMRM